MFQERLLRELSTPKVKFLLLIKPAVEWCYYDRKFWGLLGGEKMQDKLKCISSCNFVI